MKGRLLCKSLRGFPWSSSQVEIVTAPVRNATYLQAFFLAFMCFKRFCQPAGFLAARFTAQNSHEECNEFWRLSLYLTRDSLFGDTHSLDLCILSKLIFLYLWYIPPRCCTFHTLYFTPNFSYVYYHAKYFYPWWHCSSELNHYF